MAHLIDEKRLRTALAKPGKEPRMELITVYSHWMGDCTEHGAKLSSKIGSKKVKGNRLTLQQRDNSDKIVRGKIVIMSVMTHWNRLSKAVLDSPSLKVFNTKYARTLCGQV